MSIEFAWGFFAGALLLDILWRITMVLSSKLIVAQRDYINELRQHLGLEP